MSDAKYLHLIRERKPSPVDGGLIHEVWCESCQAKVYVIHLNTRPVDP